MRKLSPRRLTKRQRKQLRGANYAMEQSLKHGEDITVAGITYRGTSLMFGRGSLPYVRTQPKYQYIP